jgi:hypothetical protein
MFATHCDARKFLMKKTVLLIAGIIVVVVLLGGAAYIAGRMLSGAGPNAYMFGREIVQVSNEDGTTRTYSVEWIPAKELPSAPPESKGVLLRRADNSFFIGTGNISIHGVKNLDGSVSPAVSHSGPEVEVVVTHDTKIYRDVTEKNFDNVRPGEVKMQQVVNPGTLDEFVENSELQVWGTRLGGRILAIVFLYKLPTFTQP